ncbi:MAG: hypothetical protein HYX81_03235 [Chloroflexi bacterium]|nr:hypothetical protein [Chloroflexota bacterium]
MGNIRKLSRGERGLLLPLAILLLTAGTLLVMAVMPYLNTMLRVGYKEREQAMARYAAEAGINRVIADMVRGADAYPTTYVTVQPHRAGQPYETFTITTSYTIPSVTVNNYPATVTISLPTGSQSKPATQQNYVDPGVVHPQFATLAYGYVYLMRLYNVKAGQIQVNWAYTPSGISRIGVWAGIPVSPITNQPYPPGIGDRWPLEVPILDTGFTPANVDFNRTAAINVDPATDESGGVYTVVFDNSRGVITKTTKPFQPSGGTGDTWIYIKAYKDYLITSTAGGVTVSAYLRQVPGFAEPSTWQSAWSITNPSWITNKVYTYTWSPP